MRWMGLALLLGGCEQGLRIADDGEATANPPAEDLPVGWAYEQVLHRAQEKRDVLFVIGDCRSMPDEHLGLRQTAAEIMAPFMESPDDWHVGMLRAWAKFHQGQPAEDIGELVRGRGVNFIDKDTTAPVATFVDMIDKFTGTGWQGEAWAFEPLEKALSEPLLSTSNDGFYRPEARLDIIFIADVDETSYNTSPTGITNFLLELKSEIPRLRVHSVVVDESRGCPEVMGRDFITVSKSFPGIQASVCDQGWLDVIDEIGDDIRNASQWYYLKDLPVPETLEVRVTAEEYTFDGQLLRDDGTPVSRCDTVCAPYRYDIFTNAVRFEGFQPPLGSLVEMKYQRLRDVQ